jgi:PAS domain S-box-containing protein
LRLPSSKESADSALTPEATSALLDAAARLTSVGSPIAIVDEAGRAVGVTPFGLALFGAADRADFQRRLLSGDGPGARRLRRLAATLPIDQAPQLERVRRADGTRSASVNVRCLRIAAPDGAAFLILTADDADFGRPATSVATETRRTTPAAVPQVEGLRRRRFLWSLDREGRFAAADPALVAALGAAAPKPDETVEAACLRAVLENGDALAAAVDKRETFSGLTVLWRADLGVRVLPITLSGAPLFDGARSFIGFKGFGTIGDAIEAAKPVEPAGSEPAKTAPAQDPPGATPATPTAAEPPAHPIVSVGEENRSGAPTRPEAPDDADAHPSAPPSEPPGPSEPVASPERTAEIYVLRHGHSAPLAPSKIVPIRPGAFDASKPQESADSGDGSIELSKAEREAFREIARALVGRAPASRQETPPAADDRPAEAAGPVPETPVTAAAAPGAEPDRRWTSTDPAAVPVLRNALTLLDRLPIGVLVARDGRPLYVNLTLLALLEYRDVEHFEAADGLTAMFRGDDRPALPDADDGAFSIFTAAGRALAVEGRAQAIFWDGAPATLIMLRPARLAGRSGEQRGGEGDTRADGLANDLAEMLALAADGAVVLDPAGRIQSFNVSAERLFGYREKDVVGESVLMLLAPPSHPAATAGLESLSRLADGSSSEPPIAVVGRERDGAALALALTLARVGPPDAPYYCALFRDMRREREAERRLIGARDAALAASAAKTDFLAHVSHEIRTPLHAILGFAEVMMEERFGPIGNDRYRDYLKDIHASGRHITSLADDLLDLSKIESGKLELAFAPVDVNSLIRECVSLMQPQAARERIIMRVSLFDRLPRVMVDERSLRQIMLNLMSNAVKYNEPGGQVIVSTAVDAAGQAVIRVRDTGVGMNESEVGVALEPFGQVGRGGRKGGVGLGLPLTKALVEANRAEFSIKSRRDQGTLIEICFPIVQAAQ